MPPSYYLPLFTETETVYLNVVNLQHLTVPRSQTFGFNRYSISVIFHIVKSHLKERPSFVIEKEKLLSRQLTVFSLQVVEKRIRPQLSCPIIVKNIMMASTTLISLLFCHLTVVCFTCDCFVWVRLLVGEWSSISREGMLFNLLNFLITVIYALQWVLKDAPVYQGQSMFLMTPDSKWAQMAWLQSNGLYTFIIQRWVFLSTPGTPPAGSSPPKWPWRQ